ncbi:MAG: phosphopantetheine-binding protein [Candidatus Babeliales bacterium]
MALEVKTVITIVGAVVATHQEITEKSSLHELGIDDFDTLELIMRLEDQFHLHIDDEQFKKLQSINQIMSYLNSLV